MSKLAAAARLARRSVVEQPISPDRKDVFSSAELVNRCALSNTIIIFLIPVIQRLQRFQILKLDDGNLVVLLNLLVLSWNLQIGDLFHVFCC